MDARKLSASDGWLWIKQGHYLFRKNPLLLIALILISISILLATSRLPYIGDVAIGFLFPILFVGLMRGCQALENDEELELAHLFWAFQHRARFLISLGAINIIAESLIFVVMSNTGGKALIDLLTSGEPVTDPAILFAAIEGAGFSIPLGLLLFSALLMASQFAPMLVAFNNATPFAALKASLRACLRNIGPLSIYGAMMTLFTFVALMPMMLGLIILIPITITSIYAAYRRLFPTAEEMARMANLYNTTPTHLNVSDDGR